MYVQDFLEKYDANDAVGACEWRVSRRTERQQDQQQLGFGVGQSEWIQRVRASRSTEWSRAFIVALECGFRS